MKKGWLTHWKTLLLLSMSLMLYSVAHVCDVYFVRRSHFSQYQFFQSQSDYQELLGRMDDLGFPIDNSDRFQTLLGYISDASRLYGIEKEILLSVALVESGLNPNSLSPKGALGIFQIQPQTAQYIWEEFSKGFAMGDRFESGDLSGALKDPRLSTYMGAFYLSKLRAQFENKLHLALAAYNVGPGSLRRAMNQGELKGTEYIFRVYQLRNALKGV